MTRCFECDGKAEERHHPIPQSLGGKRTIPLCSPCHGKAHQVNRGSIPALTKLALQKRRESGMRLGRPMARDPEILARIVLLHNEGMSMNGIARLFQEENVPTVNGRGKWYASTIQAALKTHRLNQETEAILANLK